MPHPEQVLLQALLDPIATEGQVAGLFATAPFVVPPELIHPDGVPLLWQYVQLVDVASLSAHGLAEHCDRLDRLPGICVRWLDVASQDVEVKAHVRAFNLDRFGLAPHHASRAG
jgi:hypothetical protein